MVYMFIIAARRQRGRCAGSRGGAWAAGEVRGQQGRCARAFLRYVNVVIYTDVEILHFRRVGCILIQLIQVR